MTVPHGIEYTLSQGLSYTIIDQVLSAGVEMEYWIESEHGNRHNPTQGSRSARASRFARCGRPTSTSW